MPSLIAAYAVDSGGSNSNPLTTPAFTPANGEVVIVKSMTWSTGQIAGAVSGGGQTYATRKTVDPGGFNGYLRIDTTKIAGGPGSMTITQAAPSVACRHFLVVERWSNANLATTPATNATVTGTGAPSAGITTTAANSALSWCSVDENSIDPATRVYRLSGVESGIYDGHVGSNAVMYSAYAVGAAITTAGSYSIGMTAPTGQAWSMAGIEILDASAVDWTVNQTDSVGLTDTRALARSSATTDNVGLTDTRALARSSATTDNVGLTDTATVASNAAQGSTDSTGLTDAATVALSAAQAATDSAGLTDAATVALSAVQAATDSAGLTDAATAGLTAAQAATDSTGLTDTAAVAASAVQAATDSAGLTDTATVAASAASAATDSVGLTDGFTAASAATQTFTDTTGLTDALATAADHGVTSTDPAGLTDSLTTTTDQAFAVTDSVGLTDALTTKGQTDVASTDNVGATDNLTADAAAVISDTVGLSDSAASTAELDRTFTDSTGLTDTVVMVAPDPCQPLIAQTLHAVAVALRDCLCVQLANTLAGPVCRCSLMSGDTAIADICDKQPNGEGQAWVRMTRLYQSQEFPQPLTGVFRCGGGFWAAEFELGVLRCAVVPDDDGTPPSALELNCEASKIFDDAAALRWTVECCLPSALPVVPGEWTPLASGGCVGGRVTVTVLLVPGPIPLGG